MTSLDRAIETSTSGYIQYLLDLKDKLILNSASPDFAKKHKRTLQKLVHFNLTDKNDSRAIRELLDYYSAIIEYHEREISDLEVAAHERGAEYDTEHNSPGES